MNCPWCGGTNFDNAEFCCRCGRPLSRAFGASANNVIAAGGQVTMPKERRSHAGAVIAGTLCTLVVVAVLGFALLPKLMSAAGVENGNSIVELMRHNDARTQGLSIPSVSSTGGANPTYGTTSMPAQTDAGDSYTTSTSDENNFYSFVSNLFWGGNNGEGEMKAEADTNGDQNSLDSESDEQTSFIPEPEDEPLPDGSVPNVSVSDDSEPEQTASDSGQNLSADPLADFPHGFLLAHGDGYWGNEMTIQADGSFSGWSWQDMLDEETGEMVQYSCSFTGAFTSFESIGDGAYATQIAYLSITPDETRGMDQALGLGTETSASGSSFTLYTPGCDMGMLPSNIDKSLLADACGGDALVKYLLVENGADTMFISY